MKNVLILCTGNSARSILGEVLIRDLGKGRFQAFSAGSRPTGRVNPLAVELLAEMGHDTAGLRSKSWDEFAHGPAMNYIFTVCDSAAGETCPIWPGHPATAHWGLPDPAAAEGSHAERLQAFRDAYGLIAHRVRLFLDLPFDDLDGPALKVRLAEIGKAAP